MRIRIPTLSALAVVLGALTVTTAAISAECPTGATMIVVAHQDDDVTFLNPDQSADISAGRCVRVVYVTAGDGGGPIADWAPREQAAKRAHEVMAGAAEAPTLDTSLEIRGHVLAHRTLAGAPQIDMVFMRLPEGKPGGLGFRRNSGESLTRLTLGEIEAISTVPDAGADGLGSATSYTKDELTETVFALMDAFRPDTIRVQNHKAANADEAAGDHADHVAAARLSAAAAARYAEKYELDLGSLLVGYRGEDTSDYAQNVSGAALKATLASFAAYAAVDDRVCANKDCSSYLDDPKTFRGYPRWIRRQYRLDQPTPAVGATSLRARAEGDDADKCVGLRSSAGGAGILPQVEPCRGGKSQKWLYSYKSATIRPDAKKKLCARTQAYPPPNDTKVDLALCDGSDAQSWRLMATGEFVHASGKCLTMTGGGTNGSRLSVRNCNYESRQLWGYGAPAAPIAPEKIFFNIAGGDTWFMSAWKAPYSTDAWLYISRGGSKVNPSWRFPPGGQMRAYDGKCVDTRTPEAPNGEWPLTRACDRSDPAKASPSQAWRYVKRRLMNTQKGVDRCLPMVAVDVGDAAEVWRCDVETKWHDAWRVR